LNWACFHRQNFEQDSGGHQEGTSGTFLSRKVGRQAQAGLGAFFRNQEAALTHSHWQILHLAPSSQRPGEFSAWVLSDGNMYKVPVQVPRVFYLNTRAPNTEEYPGARVNRVLPHGRQSFNLIEVVIDEKQFKDAGRMLAAHLADPEVEGVYETKLPLALHALLQLGCVCMVDPKARNRTIKQGWSLNDLRMKTTTECPYLINNLSFFFLYHSSMDNRGIYALYMPAATKALVVVVNPFNNREIAAAQLERQFQNAVRSQDQLKADNSEVSCKVEYAVNNADAGRLLQRTLNEYRLSLNIHSLQWMSNN
jgi:DNA polymerase epsilon subunit 1